MFPSVNNSPAPPRFDTHQRKTGQSGLALTELLTPTCRREALIDSLGRLVKSRILFTLFKKMLHATSWPERVVTRLTAHAHVRVKCQIFNLDLLKANTCVAA